MEATSGRVGIREKPFAILVMFAGLVYTGVALLAAMVQFGFFDPSILAFGALFLVAGILILWGKPWSLVIGLVLSLLLVALYIPMLGDIVSWPGMRGACAPALTSSRRWRSVRHTPAARTCTTTSSGPSSGFGTWTSFTTPPASNRIARTAAASPMGLNEVCDRLAEPRPKASRAILNSRTVRHLERVEVY